MLWLKVLPVSNFSQLLPIARNNMQQGVQTDAKCNIQQCCVHFHGAIEWMIGTSVVLWDDTIFSCSRCYYLQILLQSFSEASLMQYRRYIFD